MACIPFMAFGFKKYLSGTVEVSMTPNKVDSLARLGDSEVFAVKHTPSHTIPEFGQSSNNDLEVSPIVGREETRNVFDDENLGATLVNQPSKFMKESRLLPSKPSSRPHPSQRDILAGESSDPYVANRDASSVTNFFDVVRPGDFRPVPFKDGDTEFVDLALVCDTEI